MSAAFVCWIWCAVSAPAGQDPAGQNQQEPVKAPAVQVDATTAARGEALAEPSEAKEPPSLFQINRQLRGLLRREAIEKDRQDWEQVVLQLVELYGQITRDERLPTSGTLEGYRVKLRSRLLSVQKRLERELRDKGIDPRTALSPGAWAAGAGPTGGEESLASRGAANTAAPGSAGGAAMDYGLLLVDLIQRTIAPEFWDVNGGPGSIVYYRTWYALVVRATPPIHRRIGGDGKRK